MRLSPRTILILTFLVYWGPSNLLSYLWGFLLFLLFYFFKREWLIVGGIYRSRALLYLLCFLAVFAASGLISIMLLNTPVNNLLWSFFTYGSTAFLVLALMGVPVKKSDLEVALNWAVYITVFQVLLGYIQMLSLQSFQTLNPFSGGKDAGDFFVGTTFNPGIGSFVAMKVSLIAIMYLPFWMEDKSVKKSLIMATLLVGWILASALFTILIGLVVIFWLLVVKRLMAAGVTFRMSKTIFLILIFGGVAIGIFAVVQRNNISYVTTSLRYAYATLMDIPTPGKESSRKIIYYKQSLGKLPFEHPVIWVAGLGPGNYSSRSAWMTSGEYLLHQPSYIKVTPSEFAQKYILNLWRRDMIGEKFKGAGSIMHQPFSTWLSVFIEMGFIALLFLILFFRKFYNAFSWLSSNQTDLFLSKIGLGLKMSLLYICALFFMENLFEYPLVMGQFFIFGCGALRLAEEQFGVRDAN